MESKKLNKIRKQIHTHTRQTHVFPNIRLEFRVAIRIPLAHEVDFFYVHLWSIGAGKFLVL